MGASRAERRRAAREAAKAEERQSPTGGGRADWLAGSRAEAADRVLAALAGLAGAVTLATLPQELRPTIAPIAPIAPTTPLPTAGQTGGVGHEVRELLGRFLAGSAGLPSALADAYGAAHRAYALDVLEGGAYRLLRSMVPAEMLGVLSAAGWDGRTATVVEAARRWVRTEEPDLVPTLLLAVHVDAALHGEGNVPGFAGKALMPLTRDLADYLGEFGATDWWTAGERGYARWDIGTALDLVRWLGDHVQALQLATEVSRAGARARLADLERQLADLRAAPAAQTRPLEQAIARLQDELARAQADLARTQDALRQQGQRAEQDARRAASAVRRRAWLAARLRDQDAELDALRDVVAQLAPDRPLVADAAATDATVFGGDDGAAGAGDEVGDGDDAPPADVFRGRRVLVFTGQERAAIREHMAARFRALGGDAVDVYLLHETYGPERYPGGAVVVFDTSFATHAARQAVRARARAAGALWVEGRHGTGTIARAAARAVMAALDDA